MDIKIEKHDITEVVSRGSGIATEFLNRIYTYRLIVDLDYTEIYDGKLYKDIIHSLNFCTISLDYSFNLKIQSIDGKMWFSETISTPEFINSKRYSTNYFTTDDEELKDILYKLDILTELSS